MSPDLLRQFGHQGKVRLKIQKKWEIFEWATFDVLKMNHTFKAKVLQRISLFRITFSLWLKDKQKVCNKVTIILMHILYLQTVLIGSFSDLIPVFCLYFSNTFLMFKPWSNLHECQYGLSHRSSYYIFIKQFHEIFYEIFCVLGLYSI